MSKEVDVRDAEEVARAFHEKYEQLAPFHGYETREASAVPWADVPEKNKGLMIEVARELLADRRINVGSRLWTVVGS